MNPLYSYFYSLKCHIVFRVHVFITYQAQCVVGSHCLYPPGAYILREELDMCRHSFKLVYGEGKGKITYPGQESVSREVSFLTIKRENRATVF